ncbi:MAG: two-component regulator propeller domain-containing protein, partial [Steroidobacter sp.]
MRLSTQFFVFLLLACLAAWPCTAEMEPPLGKSPNFSHLMMDASQSVGEVFAITQDSKGFIWFGGKTGLARYDGYRFKIYTNHPGDPHSLRSNHIHHIFEDSQRQLWIATEGGGIELYNRDRQKMLWFTGFGGMGYYDRSTRKAVQVLKGSVLDKFGIQSMLQLADDVYMLLVPPSKLFYWNKATNDLKEIRTDGEGGLPSNALRDLKMDSSGNIWVAQGKGISRFIPATGKFENYIIPNAVKGIEGVAVWSIYEDSHKVLWLATDGNGLMYFDPVSKSMGGYSNTTSPSSLSSPVVRKIFEDRAGDLWVNNFPIGVNHLDRSNNYISLYTNFIRNSEGIFRNQTWATLEDEKHNIWLGVDNMGLVYFDRKANTFSKSYEGLDFSGPEFPNTVLSLYKDSHDNLWFGTWAQGIGRLNLKTHEYRIYRPKHDNNPQSFPAASVWSMLEARNGDMYFGTMEDGFVVYSYKTNAFTVHRRDSDATNDMTPASDNVWYMWQDKQDKIWMGTNDGFAIFDPVTGRFRKFHKDVNKPGSISQNWVSSFFEDSKGRFWLSTMGGGLNLWHPETETFTYVRAQDGLGSDDVLGMVEDRFGTLWISTSAGLTAFDPDKNVFTRYTEKNWLQKGEFHTGAFGVLSSGELVFGGANGFNIFDPGRITRNNYVAPIVFTEFEVFGQPVRAGIKDSPLKQDIVNANEVVLNHEQNFFSLAFSTLNYRVYDDNRYQYILEGVDKEWHEPTATNRVTYMHLDAGNYVFRVRAANNSGVWGENEKTLKITVLPAPWKTWWAYTLYALMMLSVAFWYLQHQRERIRQSELLNAKLLELDRIKDNFMANTSHELRTPVNGIIGLTQALQDETANQLSQTAREKLDIILTCGRRLARLVNDILDFSAIKKSQLILNHRCVNLGDLIPQVISECRAQHVSNNIQVDNQLKPDLPPVFVDENRSLTIFHNLVSNAFKFTEKGIIRISATFDDSTVSVSISDTGVGIEKNQLANIFSSFEQVAASGVHQKNGTGLGLAMSKYLAELHGGRVTVDSTLGVGSVFTVTLPRATEVQRAEAARVSQSASMQPFTAKEAAHEQVDIKLPVFYPRNYNKESSSAVMSILVVDDEP